jgi:hypothetical protein
VPGPVHAAEEQDVLPAVGVVVEKRAAGPQCFREQLAAIRPAVVAEPDAGRRGDVHELEADRIGLLQEQRVERDGGRGETGAQARQEVATIHRGPTSPF